MISALSPCISFVLILLISRAFNLSWRESILAAAIILGLLLTIITEGLSALESLSYPMVLASWLLSGGALTVLYLWFFMDKGLIPVSVRNVGSAPLLFVLPIGFIVSLTGLIAFIAPPNNYDSMTYHLGRVVHWIQNHSVQHYPTSIDRQLFMPPWAGFVITHLYVLSGDDRLANAVQWLSMLGSVIGVSLIAKQLGGDRHCQVFASLIAACIPMGILQASNTQTDYVVTFWLVCFAYYVLLLLQEWQNRLSLWSPLILAGTSLGLAFLTKPTAYILAFPFLIWLSVALTRKLGGRSLQIMLAIASIAVVINLGHYIRNFELFGSPLGPPSNTSGLTIGTVMTQGEFRPVLSSFASSLIRNTALEMATTSYYGNRMVEVVVEEVEIALRVNGGNGRFSVQPMNAVARPNHEDFAGNPIHLLLIGFCGAVMVGRLKRGSRSIANSYALSLLAGYLSLCLFLKWNIYITRLHLPLFVLWSATIATVLSEPVFARARTYIIIFLLVTSQHVLFYNLTRPLIGAQSIFAVPRLEQYFRNGHSGILAQYSYAATLLKDMKCSQVGLWLGNQQDSWEYPLWILLQDRKIDGLRIEHVHVSNQSARASLDGEGRNFVPCGIVLVELNEMPDQIIEGGRAYSKTWMGNSVAVYEVAKDRL